MSDGSDQDLARRAANGEAAAFASLLERHYDRIHRVAWRLTGTRTDAEDVAQDVCVKLATAIRSFRGDAEVSTWIWRITYNAATDILRSRQRTFPLEPSEMMMLVDGAEANASRASGPQASRADASVAKRGSATTWASEASEKNELWAVVRRLPNQQRDAVLLVYGEDMSHGAAARVMGCTEKTVSWHLHEARKRLKAMLETAG